MSGSRVGSALGVEEENSKSTLLLPGIKENNRNLAKNKRRNNKTMVDFTTITQQHKLTPL